MLEKIDIIEQDVYCYDDKFNLIKTLKIDQFKNIDFSYLNGSKLFTVNINRPIKRVIKFSEINSLESNAEFVEFPYSDMTIEQKVNFDNFVEQVNNL